MLNVMSKLLESNANIVEKINEKQEEINSSIKELMGKYGIVEEDAQ